VGKGEFRNILLYDHKKYIDAKRYYYKQKEKIKTKKEIPKMIRSKLEMTIINFL
jgi:hypothetical protein